MFCPVCKAEYREGFTRCADCGVELTASPPADATVHDSSEVAWRGGDPVALTRVAAALGTAGITFEIRSTYRHLAFDLAMPRPFYEVRVARSQLTAALSLVEPIPDPPAFAPAHPPDDVRDDAETTSASPGKVADDLKPQEPALEVWQGDDEGLLVSLRNCLRENGIGSRLLAEPSGSIRLLVRPEDAGRAREIVREVLEGTPPQ